VSGKEVEIIMAFRQIVGVSCDGHTDKLRRLLHSFWLVRLISWIRSWWGEVRLGKKPRENWLTFFLR
jgi:hypothetical protein